MRKTQSTFEMIHGAKSSELREVIRVLGSKPEWAKEVELAKKILSQRQDNIRYKRNLALHY